MVFIDDSAKIVCRFRVWTLQPLEYVPKEYLIDIISGTEEKSNQFYERENKSGVFP